jgi:NTP pyrophosphatase (non-canonical NTP hydrolase)
MQKSNNVSLQDIQEHTKETYKEEHSLAQLMLSLAGETGEALNIVKKIRRAQHDPKFEKANGMNISDLKKKLALELIDIIYYCAETANEINMDLEFIWEIKKDLNAVKYSRKEKLDPLTQDYLKLENEL